MASPPKYPEWVRDTIAHLCNEEDMTGIEVARLLADGYDGHEPVTITDSYVRKLALDARRRRITGLDDQPLGEAIDTLARRTLSVVATEITRLQQETGALDADQILKLARTIKELHPLAQTKNPTPDPNNPDRAKPPWLQDLEPGDVVPFEHPGPNHNTNHHDRSISGVAAEAA